MTDRVLVYDRTGLPLGELPAAVTRSWQTRRDYEGSRATLEISTRISKCNRSLIKHRNFVVVKSDMVEDWAGIMWRPRSWSSNGILSVQMYSAEHLFSFRLTGLNDVYNAVSGNIFLSLLSGANAKEDTRITYLSTDIDLSGNIIGREYHRDNVMDAMNSLARDVDNHWWVYPQADSSGLNLYAKWQQERGTVFAPGLIEGKNLTNVELVEEGDIANALYVWNQPDDWEDAVEGSASDANSISENGLIEDGFAAMNTTDQDSLTGIAAAQLGLRKNGRITVMGDVVSPPFPRVGDFVSVWLVSVGFLGTSGIGGVIPMRVYSCAYSPNPNQMSVILKESDEDA